MADFIDKLFGVFYDCEEDVSEPTIHEKRAKALREKPIRLRQKYAAELRVGVRFMQEKYAEGVRQIDLCEIINIWAHEDPYYRDMNYSEKTKYITDVCRVLYAQNLIESMPTIRNTHAYVWFV